MHRPLIFGIKALEHIMMESGMKDLTEDKRISALLADQVMVMKNKVEFMINREKLLPGDAQECLVDVQMLEKKTMVLRNLVLKNLMVSGSVNQDMFLKVL